MASWRVQDGSVPLSLYFRDTFVYFDLATNPPQALSPIRWPPKSSPPPLSSTTISPRDTLTQELEKRSRANEYVLGAHREKDSVRKVVTYSKKVEKDHRYALGVYYKQA